MPSQNTSQRAAPRAKLHKYPVFHVVGMVSVFKRGDSDPTISLQSSCYCNHRDEAERYLRADARHRLSSVGVSHEQIKELFIEYSEVTGVVAKDPRGVRNPFDEPVEAFIDYGGDLPKRDQLIRQRRILPWDHQDMVSIYGPKLTAIKPPEEGVAA